MAGDSALRDGDWISFGGLLGQFSDLSEEKLAAEQERARTRWEETLERSRRLDPKADLDRLLQQVLSSSMELAGAERGFVMLPGDDGQLQQRAQAGGVDAAGAIAGFPGSRGALERARATLKPVVVCDAGADTLLGVQPSVVVGQIRALVCLPLTVGERLTGLLYLDSKSPGKVFTRLDVEILEAFAAHAALVVGIATVREDLAALPQSRSTAGKRQSAVTDSNAGPDPDATKTSLGGQRVLAVGTLVAGRYRVIGLTGVGAMGMVYRVARRAPAHRRRPEGRCAPTRPDARMLERFEQELVLARQVTHKNVVRIHDIGQDGDLHFLTMDHVDGRSLRQILDERTRLPVDEVVRNRRATLPRRSAPRTRRP